MPRRGRVADRSRVGCWQQLTVHRSADRPGGGDRPSPRVMNGGEGSAASAGNHRNGTSAKRVRTRLGTSRLDVPSGPARATFAPQIVPKHARRVEGFDEAIVSACMPKGLTTGEIQRAPGRDLRTSRAVSQRIWSAG